MRKHRRKNKQRKIIVISLVSFLFIMIGGYAAFQTNLNITAKGNIVDRSRVIQSWSYTDKTDFHSDYYRENIVSATFLDDARVPSNAVESWDVSESKDKGVMAWVVQNNEDNTKYDLYIGANGGVIANENSCYLFHNFYNILSINFNQNFDTSNVINMVDMFYGCNSIKQLDVSDFDTSNVTTMGSMFFGCNQLTNIDLSNFNTSNVTTFDYMFANCDSLVDINLQTFNTNKTINLSYMFYHCDNLETINLCSFNTTNVTNMRRMFENTPNLKNVYVGSNWNTANANTKNMFSGSSISSVTTGEC